MEDKRQAFGKQGEQDAAERAVRRGYSILERNYRTPYGEIDLILRSPENEIVFAEVKARTGTFFGYPESAVTRQKKDHIIRSAYYYLQQNDILYIEPNKTKINRQAISNASIWVSALGMVSSIAAVVISLVK